MRFTTITSPSNSHIREATAVREKRRKYGSEAFLLEGPHLVEMALISGTSIRKTFFTEEYAARREGAHLLRRISHTGAEMFQVGERILSKLSDTEAPQGIIALASYRPRSPEDIPLKENPLLVVIDGVQDPGNLGTIIRTSDAAGADAVVILPETCDSFMPKVLRSTAGSIFNLPLVHADVETFLKWVKGRSIRVLVTDMRATDDIFHADLSQSLAFVFGNEAHGVSERLRRAADGLLRIPIRGKAESLNVAISAAVCLYETVRQRMVKRG